MKYYLVIDKTYNKIFILNDNNLQRYINHVNIIVSSYTKQGIHLYCYLKNINF